MSGDRKSGSENIGNQDGLTKAEAAKGFGALLKAIFVDTITAPYLAIIATAATLGSYVTYKRRGKRHEPLAAVKDFANSLFTKNLEMTAVSLKDVAIGAVEEFQSIFQSMESDKDRSEFLSIFANTADYVGQSQFGAQPKEVNSIFSQNFSQVVGRERAESIFVPTPAPSPNDPNGFPLNPTQQVKGPATAA